MKEIDSSKPISFESANLPNQSYIFRDSGNNPVIVRPPVPENHTPHGGFPQDPAIHQNVGYGIRNYDYKEITERKTDGYTVTYEKYDIFESINHPNRFTMKGVSLVAAVWYGFNGENYVKTFYDKPGGF